MQFAWKCIVCGISNTIDQGDGYFYLAATRCLHAKEIFADYRAFKKSKKKIETWRSQQG